MDLVLWIDQNEIATKLFEKVFKEEGVGLHTISSTCDFIYLIKDLDPQVIVLDAETGAHNLEALKQQYDLSGGFYGKPVILIDPRAGLEFIKNVIGEIKRPINPFDLPQLLIKLTGSSQ